MEKSEIINHWNNYYSVDCRRLEPSQFSEFVISTFPKRRLIIDVGCGSGRDAYSFASNGWQVLGLDVSESAIDRAREHCRRFAASCCFLIFDISSDELCRNDIVASFDAKDILIYARFFLHAIPHAAERAFLSSVAPLVKAGSLLCIECRSLKDAELPKAEGEHYRRFIDPDMLASQCASLGMKIQYSEVGRGLARYGSEDPEIVRMIVGALDDCASPKNIESE